MQPSCRLRSRSNLFVRASSTKAQDNRVPGYLMVDAPGPMLSLNPCEFRLRAGCKRTQEYRVGVQKGLNLQMVRSEEEANAKSCQ